MADNADAAGAERTGLSRAVVWTGIVLGTALAILAMTDGMVLRIGGMPSWAGVIVGALIVWALIAGASVALAELTRRHHKTAARYAARQGKRGAVYAGHAARRHSRILTGRAAAWAGPRWDARKPGGPGGRREEGPPGASRAVPRQRGHRGTVPGPDGKPGPSYSFGPADSRFGWPAGDPDYARSRAQHMSGDGKTWVVTKYPPGGGPGTNLAGYRNGKELAPADIPPVPQPRSTDEDEIHGRMRDLIARHVRPDAFTGSGQPAEGNPGGAVLPSGTRVTQAGKMWVRDGQIRASGWVLQAPADAPGKPYPLPSGDVHMSSADVAAMHDLAHGPECKCEVSALITAAQSPAGGTGPSADASTTETGDNTMPASHPASRISPARRAHGAAARSGGTVPAEWNTIIARTADFEPESDGDLLDWMAAEITGVAAYAEALVDLYEGLVQGTGLDPVGLSALHDVADAQAHASETMSGARRKFADHYDRPREFAAEGGLMPHDGRWVTGEGDA